jgi:hypothetical protein
MRKTIDDETTRKGSPQPGRRRVIFEVALAVGVGILIATVILAGAYLYEAYYFTSIMPAPR